MATLPSVLMIVARDRAELYDRLSQAFANDRAIAVLLDRWHGQRRSASMTVTAEQRRAERRRRDIEEDLRSLGWATTRAS
jgi:hypothetical protein